jgi:mannitol operon transcriptional antiterminator
MSQIILDSRQRKIISILCNETDFITIGKIAKAVDVSSRTISRAMDPIEKWFEENNTRLIKKTRIGLKIDATLEERNEILQLLNEEDIYKIYSPEERRLIMTLELLEKKKITKLLYFSNYFKVSNSTISKDLDVTEEWLEKYNLKLIRKQGYGITVEGLEKNFRKAIINLLYDNTQVYELGKLIKNTVKQTSMPTDTTKEVRKRLLNLIDRETLTVLERILDEGEKHLNYELADSAYVGLLVHLSIAIKRISNGERIIIDPDYLIGLKKCNEFIVAELIAEGIAEDFKIEIPDSEIGYITMHLKGAKLRNGNFSSGNLLGENESIIGNYQLTKVVLKMLTEVKRLSGYDLKDDKKLLVGLISHLRPALSRIQMKMDIRNPLLDQVKNNYPEIYDLSNQAVKVIEEWAEVKIPDSEIGFLAMHIGAALETRKMLNSKKYNVIVTCSSGMGTSSLLASKIVKEYKNINIIASSSTRKLEKLIKEETIDFIISTVTIDAIDVPYVKVSPLLLEDDKKMIRGLMEKISVPNEDDFRKLKKAKLKKDIDFQKLNESIYKIINHFFLEEAIEVDDKLDLINWISNSLSSGNENYEDIKSTLIDREYIESTIVTDQNILLLHGKTKKYKKLTFGVIRLKNSINEENYHNEMIQVKNIIVMLAHEDASQYEIDTLSYISKSLIERESFVKSLINDSKDVFKKNLINVLNDYMRERIV